MGSRRPITEENKGEPSSLMAILAPTASIWADIAAATQVDDKLWPLLSSVEAAKTRGADDFKVKRGCLARRPIIESSILLCLEGIRGFLGHSNDFPIVLLSKIKEHLFIVVMYVKGTSGKPDASRIAISVVDSDSSMGGCSDGFHYGFTMSKGKDTIMVVVDRLSKYAHFFVLSNPYTIYTTKVVNLFVRFALKLHGIPKTIVSDKDWVFIMQFGLSCLNCKAPN